MDSTPNGTATENGDALTVSAHKQAPAYQQVAAANYRRFTRADEQCEAATEDASEPKATGPNEALIARADEGLAHAYEQIARADEQLARLTEQLSKLEPDATRRGSAKPGRPPSSGWSLVRGVVGLVLAACIFAAALGWQSSYGEAARLAIARWAPQLGSTSSLALKEASAPAQPSQSSSRMADAGPMPPQTGPQGVAATAALSPELAQRLLMIGRDMTDVQRRIDELEARHDEMTNNQAKTIEQLKASQDQMANDNAKALERLKASQEQMARDNASAFGQLKASQEQAARDNAKAAEQLKAMASFTAKISKQSLQPKVSAPPPRPNSAGTRQPVSLRRSSQGGAQP